MYLKVSISDFLTLFSARTHDGFFWSSKPSPILLVAAFFALFLSTLLACVWPTEELEQGEYVMGLAEAPPRAMAFYVWLYCIFWWFIQDAAKVAVYWYMEKFNTFGINDPLMIEQGRKMLDPNSLNTPLLDDMGGDVEAGSKFQRRVSKRG
jgi:H+-transporting ATPase